MLEVVFRFHDRHLFEQQMAKGLEAALGKYHVTYGYNISDRTGEQKKKLREYMTVYRGKEY